MWHGWEAARREGPPARPSQWVPQRPHRYWSTRILSAWQLWLMGVGDSRTSSSRDSSIFPCLNFSRASVLLCAGDTCSQCFSPFGQQDLCDSTEVTTVFAHGTHKAACQWIDVVLVLMTFTSPQGISVGGRGYIQGAPPGNRESTF